jgi:hypothetical protein
MDFRKQHYAELRPKINFKRIKIEHFTNNWFRSGYKAKNDVYTTKSA